MYTCMPACMHACMHACMYVCMYVSTYVCMYVSTYMSVFASISELAVCLEGEGHVKGLTFVVMSSEAEVLGS